MKKKKEMSKDYKGYSAKIGREALGFKTPKSKLMVQKVTVEIEVPFYSYDTVAKNAKASSQIKNFIKDVLKDNISFIDLEVTEDDVGCSKETKIKIASSSLA